MTCGQTTCGQVYWVNHKQGSYRSKYYDNYMPRCACASEVYGSVFVCLCVCRPLQLLKDDFNSWICKIMLRSRVMPSFAYLECHCSLFRRVRSKTCSPSATLLSS